MLDDLFEAGLELAFDQLPKAQPEKMPDLPDMDAYTVKHPVATAAIMQLILVVATVGCCVAAPFTHEIFYVFAFLSGILFLLYSYSFSIQCTVTQEKLSKRVLFLIKKEISWTEIRCVRVVEKTDVSAVTIILYGQNGKSVADYSSDMDNAWQLVKTALRKRIPVREEKDLTIRQMSHL